jgi:hypothetical protein
MNRELYGISVANGYDDTRRISPEERWLRLTGRPQSIRGASKYRGVSIYNKDHERPWQATLAYKGKRFRAGVFATEEEAALAWNKMALRIVGPLAKDRLNVVPSHHES